MKIKICGIRDVETALYTAQCGADALGFVFYESSPRYIDPESAKIICDSLPPFVSRVGLFVECTAQFVNETCKTVGIDIAQIHFEADEDFYDALEVKYIKVVRSKSAKDIDKFSGEFRFVDSFVDGYGGEGKRLNLDWFDDVDRSKIILAGGLTPDNVSEVLEYGFYGVDVSSGVESAKGIKDRVLIKEFIDMCKSR